MAREELAILTAESLREELAREEARHHLKKILLNAAGVLMVIAALTTLVATRLLSLLQVNGSSMDPTLRDGELVLLLQTREVEVNDIIGFHYGGEVLLKRVIGRGGDEIEISQEGKVSVNGRELAEPYLSAESLGTCELTFPYQVPEGMLFVLGDNRAVSMDSRIRAIGCVEESQIIGKVVFRGWPWDRIGMMH